MKKRRKRHSTGSRTLTSAPTEGHGQPEAVNYAWGGWSGYAGANFSENRGAVQFPEMDTAKELDSYSRTELIRKIRFLARNEGVLKGFVNNAPRFVGLRTPRAATKDEEWNREMNQRFLDRMGKAEVFDVAGKFNFWTAQPMVLRGRFTDGDMISVLSKSQTGRARFAFYEAHQLANPKDGGERWNDGVLTDRLGKHLQYGLRDGASGNGVRVDKRDAYYLGYFDSPGHVRAVPPLAHAVNHFLDRMEIRSNMKQAIKGASLTSHIRESDVGVTGKSKDGLPGIIGSTRAPNGGDYGTVKVWNGGQIIDNPPGVTSKVLHDERPSPNQMEAMKDLVRDGALGFGLPVEVLYAMEKLTGPGIRLVLDLADSWITDQQENQDNWVELQWVYFAATEMKYGGMRRPKDERWWAHHISGTRNLTIDRSKELKTRMEAVERGYDTAENLCEEMFGTNADDVDAAHIARTKRRMEKCEAEGVPYDRAYPPLQGAAVAPGEEEEDTTDDVDEEEPEKEEKK